MLLPHALIVTCALSMLQCIPWDKQCDGNEDCKNGDDEQFCYYRDAGQSINPRSHVYLEEGILRVATDFPCKETAFQCTGIELCLSYELRCNGVYDCPGKEDETGCQSCQDFYRCRGSQVCLHPLSVCDEYSRVQCPLGDDELLCDSSTCPENCTCYGLAVYCEHGFPAGGLTQLRFLEARGSSGLTLADVAGNTFLVHLALTSCGLQRLGNSSFPNLRFLDISDNLLTAVSLTYLHVMLSNLQVLILSGNPLASAFIDDVGEVQMIESLQFLDVSGVRMTELDTKLISPFANLRQLNLSQSGVETLSGQGFTQLTRLTTLDLRGCPLTHFSRDVIRGLASLRTLRADNYKLCCPATLPAGFNPSHCQAPSDEVSSCDALLRADAYRVVLAAFAVLALVGNLGSFAYRVIVKRTRGDLGFGVFVTHLSVSDFLMGLYLAIIGLADRVYKGTYLWEDAAWRTSAACNLAGCVFLMSTEISAFLMTAVTLDRFLVLNFPFSKLRFHPRSAHLTSFVAWFTGAVLSLVPLLPAASHWRFYSRNGICIPLPIATQKRLPDPDPGQPYSFSVMIVLNFTLFCLIAVGQLSIYFRVRASACSADDAESKKHVKDLDVARRLFTIAASDFACWFLAGLLGLLASAGSPVPGEVSVAVTMLVLPFNSALNPFLYAFSVVSERRRRDKEKRLRRLLVLAQRRGKIGL